MTTTTTTTTATMTPTTTAANPTATPGATPSPAPRAPWPAPLSVSASIARPTTRALGLALALALAVSAWPGPAHASPCGGSDDSGGSSSSSSSDDSGSSWFSDSDDSDDGDDTPACTNSTDIVGRAECTRFGAWDASFRPRLQLSIGVSTRQISLPGTPLAGEAEHEKSLAYRVESEELGPDAGIRAYTLDARLTGSVGRHGYAGVEGSVGGGVLDGDPWVTRGDLVLQFGGGIYASAAVVAGFSIPVTRRTAIGAEGAVGRQWTTLFVRSRYFDCVDTSVVTDARWFAAPRLVARRWLGPHVTLAAHVGSDALRDGGVSMGVMLTGHARGFDGARGRR